MSELLPTIFAGFAKRRYKGKRRLIVAGEAGEGLTEYLPRTTLDALLKAEREKALREAVENLSVYAPSLVDGPEHDVGYYYGYATAFHHLLDLISEDATDG